MEVDNEEQTMIVVFRGVLVHHVEEVLSKSTITSAIELYGVLVYSLK